MFFCIGNRPAGAGFIFTSGIVGIVKPIIRAGCQEQSNRTGILYLQSLIRYLHRSPGIDGFEPGQVVHSISTLSVIHRTGHQQLTPFGPGSEPLGPVEPGGKTNAVGFIGFDPDYQHLVGIAGKHLTGKLHSRLAVLHPDHSVHQV